MVVVLDTDVISELIDGPNGDPAVAAWARSLREQPTTTAINRAELLAGALRLPEGRRRDELTDGILDILSRLRDPLPFTSDCAAAFAEVTATRRQAGRPIGIMDALIASTALVNRAAVATRDAGGFAGLGLEVVDPWSFGD